MMFFMCALFVSAVVMRSEKAMLSEKAVVMRSGHDVETGTEKVAAAGLLAQADAEQDDAAPSSCEPTGQYDSHATHWRDRAVGLLTYDCMPHQGDLCAKLDEIHENAKQDELRNRVHERLAGTEKGVPPGPTSTLQFRNLRVTAAMFQRDELAGVGAAAVQAVGQGAAADAGYQYFPDDLRDELARFSGNLCTGRVTSIRFVDCTLEDFAPAAIMEMAPEVNIVGLDDWERSYIDHIPPIPVGAPTESKLTMGQFAQLVENLHQEQRVSIKNTAIGLGNTDEEIKKVLFRVLTLPGVDAAINNVLTPGEFAGRGREVYLVHYKNTVYSDMFSNRGCAAEYSRLPLRDQHVRSDGSCELMIYKPDTTGPKDDDGCKWQEKVLFMNLDAKCIPTLYCEQAPSAWWNLAGKKCVLKQVGARIAAVEREYGWDAEGIVEFWDSLGLA